MQGSLGKWQQKGAWSFKPVVDAQA